MRRAWCWLVVLLLSGCAGALPPLDTQSGLPELLYRGASVEDVRGRLVAARVADGFRVVESSPGGVVLSRPSPRFMTIAVFPDYDGEPEWRRVYSFTAMDAGTMVRARSEVVRFRGSRQEEEKEVTRRLAPLLQQELEQVRDELRAAVAR